MNVLELNQKSDVACSNIKEKKRAVLNVESDEMGLQSAKSLGLVSHISHYETEIRRKTFETYEFPKLFLKKTIREFFNIEEFILSQTGRSSTKNYRLNKSISFNNFNIMSKNKLIGKIGIPEDLKSIIPSSILTKMAQIKSLGLADGFFVIGEPDAFIKPKADPIVVAFIAERPSEINLTNSVPNLYFVGKYN